VIIVSDAGPLIALAKIERFGLLRELFGKLYIPQAVYDEVVVIGTGRAGANETEQAVGDWIEVLEVKDLVMVKSLLTKLGKGESEAIALALETKADMVLLDDYKARATAEFMGLNMTGTVGMLSQAQKKGLISDLRSLLDELRAGGFRLSDKVYAEILKR
jgi:predicted nucleic acid-binding protein